MLNVFFPSPPVPTISIGLYSLKSTGTRISSKASRNPVNSSTEILRIRNTVIRLAIWESL